MADDESSELSSVSSLSSAPSDDDGEVQLKREKGILKFFHKLPKGAKTAAAESTRTPSPPLRKRSPSPPHDYVLADNPDLAFIVMFRSRFNEALPKSLANFGPQELERDATESLPGERMEHFLCAILGLLLNRKQDVKPGHYNRALEDAISTHKNQWPRDWEEKSPLSGSKTFASMTPTERLTLLRTLVLWTLSSSEVIKGIINQSYKQNRHEDDLNQPLSVQPWGSDTDRRRYYLVEGLDDTNFRVYRESNPAGFNRTWWSVAGTIDELKVLCDRLETKDGGPKAKLLAQRMQAAIPRFEATEEKRKRREYRLMRKEQFKRPEPGFSLYEGRTRGKRMKYTYSDDEDFYSDSTPRRSTRNTGTHTPAEPTGPITTASGRQVKAPSRMTVDSSNNIITTSPTQESRDTQSKDASVGPSGRPRRSAAVNRGTNGWAASKSKGYSSVGDEMDYDEGDSESDVGDDEDEDEHIPNADSEDNDDEDENLDEDETMADDDLDDTPKSMLVKLKYSPKANGLSKTLGAFRYTGGEGEGAKEPVDQPEDHSNAATNKESIAVSTTKRRRTPESAAEPTAKRQKTPEPTAAINAASNQETVRSGPALTALHPTSMAFRGSPEKPQQQQQKQKPTMSKEVFVRST